MKLKRSTWLLALCLCPATTVMPAQSVSVRVTSITDGDTVIVLGRDLRQRKVRLAGIDAPEKKQPFGQRSKQHLSDLVFGKDVALMCGKVDRYGRDICVVYIDGKDANLAQVEAGLAWWYRKYAKEQTAQQRRDYEAAESTAKSTRIGIWSEPNPQAPWEFRHSKH